MKNKKQYIIFVAISLLIILGGGGFYYYYKIYVPAHELALISMSIQKSQPARDAFNMGDYNTSIEGLGTLISRAPTKTERGRLQLLLASDLLARNQGEDTLQAISLLKQIINDYSMAPWVRAVALNNIAKLITSKDIKFYDSNFSDSPFNEYLPTSGSDEEKLLTAYFKILQLSDNTYPNSLAEYVIAGNYYAIRIQNATLSDAEIISEARTIQQYIKEGDSRNDQSLYSPVSILIGQYYRALGIAVSARVLKNVNLTDQENAFRLTINTAKGYQQQQGTSNNNLSAMLLKADFSYADFLLQNYGLKRQSDIQMLLAPFGASDALALDVSPLNILASFPNSNHTKTEAIKLASVSSDFKKFLISTGVTF